jgi:hypothetical protein
MKRDSEAHAHVERHPVDRAATDEELGPALEDKSIEVRETAEEPVVEKTARVVEEVEVRKDVTQRTEKVQDKVRRTDVNVENLGGGQTSGVSGDRVAASTGVTAEAGSMDVDDLNRLLRDELSAIETYCQALDKNREAYGEDARFQQLAQMLRDHEQAASQLRSMIRQPGGTASNDSGVWGTWANTVMGTAKLFSDKAALKAFKESEESGIEDYQAILDPHLARN